jgi:hypothetical protein
MLIRSQNKKCLVEINKMIILASGKMVICYDTSCIMDEVYVNLGNYSSDEKALKVLDMIQEAYMEYKSGEIVGNGLAGSAYTGSYDTKESVAHGIAVLKGYGNEIRKSILFQMPEDSEV